MTHTICLSNRNFHFFRVNDQGLLDEVEILRRELDEYRKHAGSGGDDFMREIQRLSNKNRIMEQDLNDKDQALFEEKNKADKLSNRVEEVERETRNLKRERETLALRREGDSAKTTVAKKNKELSEYLDEIKILQEENETLGDQLINVKKELEESAMEMNKMTDEYTKLKTILQQSDLILNEMRRERDALRSQVQDLRVQVSSKSDADDQIMMAVNLKVEEWKHIMASKDVEIAQHRAVIAELKQRITGLELDSDKTSLVMLQQVLMEKEEHIQMLKQEVEKATVEMRGVADQVEEVKAQSEKGIPSAFQQKKIAELGSTLRREQLMSAQERGHLMKAEEAARQKDKQLNDLMTRMMQYEKGEYGLSEAVQEIKDIKAQIRIRDQNVENLTSQVNKLNLLGNDLEMENEEFRERLGLDPRDKLDIEDIRQKKKVKAEQASAMNRVLVKEIERLEDERLKLKKQLRKQALHRGARAVELGITAEDLADVEDEPGHFVFRKKVIEDSDTEEARTRNKRLQNDIENSEKESEKVKSDLKKIEVENDELKDENKQLEIGLREILAQLRENSQQAAVPVDQEQESTPQAVSIQVPALEKLMAMIESRNAVGQYDTNLQLKAQIEQLTGGNAELRHELQNARNETSKSLIQVEHRQAKSVCQPVSVSASVPCASQSVCQSVSVSASQYVSQSIEQLQEENKVLKEIGEGVVKLQPLLLPEGMTPSSSEIIGSLNEHLIQTLQELSLKEEMIVKMEKDLENYKRKFSVITHQQGILYSDYTEEKKKWEEDIKTKTDEKKAVELAREQDIARLKEFERLLDTLSQDPNKQMKRLSELTRKITVLRVNEKSLSRRYTAMQEVETALRKESKKLNNEIVEMETAVAERLGYLQRHKEMATYKIHALQQALDDSVSSKELENANKQYNELTAKYRDLLQRENTLVSRTVLVENLETDVKALQEREAELKKDMTSLKERNHSLEQMLNELLAKDGKSVGDSSPARQEEINRISRKLATLEMKELNERERAEHSTRKYEQLKKVFDELEIRNADLEHKFSEIGMLNLEAQRIERHLREELEGAVTKNMHQSVVKRLQSSEETESKLKVEVSRLKEVAEVAAHQTEAVRGNQESQDKELMALRKQLYDVQMESDDKTIIGKLHHHIVALQVSEGMAVRKLESAIQKVSKLEAQILRLEQKIDEKDQTLYHTKMENRNKEKFLKRTIQELRRQYSGSLPLMKQERFANTMRSLQEDKLKLEQEVNQAKARRESAEDKLAELQLKQSSLEELIATLKDHKGAVKVTEWHSKLNEIRLQDLKLNRTLDRVKQQNKHLDNVIRSHERAISDYEEEIVQLSKHHEERQLLWEQREVELERTVDRLEKQQKDMLDAATRFEEATGAIPDPNLPVANQLELAVRKIREHIKVIIGTKHENKNLNKKYEEAEQALKQYEEKLLQKDKIINELRLRLPVSERDAITRAASKSAEKDDYEARQALKVAQATVSSLQQMLARKEQSLGKYQEMLKDARDEAKKQADQHKLEIKLLQDRLHLESDEVFKRMKLSHQESINAPGPLIPTEDQLARLGELEETVAEQDNALAIAAEKFKRSREENVKLRKEHMDQVNTMKKDYERKSTIYEKQIKELRDEIQIKDDKYMVKRKENEVLREELDAAKEANERAPTRTMKQLVERLRNQLVLKEKQQKSLSHALLQLRADMVTTAEENVQIHANRAEQEVNVQHVVNKETSGLQTRIEELQERMEKLKRELKNKRDKEMSLVEEKDKLKQELSKRDSALIKLGAELKDLESVEDRLEQKEEQFAEEKRKVVRVQSEAEKLRKKVKSLEDQLGVERAEGEIVVVDTQDVAEAAPLTLDFPPEPKSTKSNVEVARWEENKKWQRKVESFREKLNEKTKELEKCEKTNIMLREALQRGEKDKTGLHNRLKSASRVGSTPVIPPSSDEFVQDLKHKIFAIEEENQDLKRQLVLGHDRQLEALQLRNDQLNEAVRSLEDELSRRMNDQRTIDQSDAEMYRDIHEKNQSLQRQLLEAKEENMELRFEYEQARKENPRLKARVDDLQEYVEILKAELESSKKREKARKVLEVRV
ncbi:hypothetical protein QZH41_012933 [Actinostola sp. cb2023]|nr:hypothetical protein QZH41_012933 [Actinostola sp. cb2023]